MATELNLADPVEARLADYHASAMRIKADRDELLATMAEAEQGIAEAVRILDLMGRGGDARHLQRHGNNMRAVMRKVGGQ